MLGLPRLVGPLLKDITIPKSRSYMRTTGTRTFASLRIEHGKNNWIHHRWLPISEAERMLERKEVTRFRMPRQRHPVYRLIPVAEPSKSEMTPPSITVSDMLINAGFGNPEEIRRVRAKVKEFQKSRLICGDLYTSLPLEGFCMKAAD